MQQVHHNVGSAPESLGEKAERLNESIGEFLKGSGRFIKKWKYLFIVAAAIVIVAVGLILASGRPSNTTVTPTPSGNTANGNSTPQNQASIDDDSEAAAKKHLEKVWAGDKEWKATKIESLTLKEAESESGNDSLHLDVTSYVTYYFKISATNKKDHRSQVFYNCVFKYNAEDDWESSQF